MRAHTSFRNIAVLLALVGLAFGLAFLSRLPRTLTVAVGPGMSEVHLYAEALALATIENKERIRFKVISTKGAEESARLLDERKTDLALIRSDYELPISGQTLLVNAIRTVVIMAPQRRAGIQKLSDLKGKRLAIARFADTDVPLVRKILAVADIGEKDVTLIESDMDDIPELMGTSKVDAAIAVAVLSSPRMIELVPKIAKRFPGGLRIVPIDQSQTVANRNLGVETIDIPAGAFGTGRPVEELQSVAVSYRIMAHKAMPDSLADISTKTIYDLRARLSRKMPISYNLEAPDAKTGARIAVHPGASAFFDGETKTLFERYGEVILTLLWGLSIIGSGLTGFLHWAGQKRLKAGRTLVDEILQLTREVRTASKEDLERIELRGDAIVAMLAQQRQSSSLSEAIVESASIALEHFRSVISDAKSGSNSSPS